MAGIGVALGAIGAHFVPDFLNSAHAENPDKAELVLRRMDNWKTAALYQMFHAIGMLVVGVISLTRPHRLLNFSGWMFLLGIILFSGLLYTLVLTEIRVLGAIVPLGGTSFIVGWVLVVLAGKQIACERPSES